MTIIQPFTSDYDEFLRDESRSVGTASFIAFPETEDDVCAVLRELHAEGTPVTVQGSRTGLAAGAVPQGGCILNLSRMNRHLGMRRDEDGRFFLRVQPGITLMELNHALRTRSIPADGWDAASLEARQAFLDAPLHMFPTDPTETSASIGGMAACNASGARSYRYGAMRGHVSAVRLAIADGDMVSASRGQAMAHDGVLSLTTEGGRVIAAPLPSYAMPHAKCASGYYMMPAMDAVDVIVGSDGTLGVITELELELMDAPQSVWDVACFLPSEQHALDFVAQAHGIERATSIEYIDAAALDVLRERATGDVPLPPEGPCCCVSIEIGAEDDDAAMESLETLMEALEQAGGDADATWVASTEAEREGQRVFRHAVPENVNRIIDERRRTYPHITKLGSDMSVPFDRLPDAVALYRSTLAREGLEAATWGHIGDAHLHVNILPRDMDEYARGKALFAEWAREITAMGGAVSAEHGVGKLKRDFLEIMYGEDAIREMAHFKLVFDPKGQLGRGNFFSEELLDSLKG